MYPSSTITLAIVGFVFVCIIFPKIVRNRPQFYMAVLSVVLIMLFEGLAMIFGGAGFTRFMMVLVLFCNLAGFVLLILATGGLSLKELTGEITSAIEVMRRGETEKDVIIPTSQPPSPRAAAGPRKADDEGRTTYVIDDPAATPKPPAAKSGDGGSIPLE